MKFGGFDAIFGTLNWNLMVAVQKDARTSFAQMGRAVGLSAPAVAERLRRLEDRGVILGYHARINPHALGLKLLVFIEVQVKRGDYPRFQKAISSLNWILECHHIAGRAAFIVKAAVPDPTGLELLIGHLSQFGETVTSLVLSSVVEQRAFTDSPNSGSKVLS